MPEDKKNNSTYDNSYFENNTLGVLKDSYENSYGGLDLAMDIPFYYDVGKDLLQGNKSFKETAKSLGPVTLGLGRKPLGKGTKGLFNKTKQFLPLTAAGLLLGSNTSERTTASAEPDLKTVNN